MSKPKVSVIIPVYNVEFFLSQCLESVFKQTLSEIEILCVNDGSTDSSLEILKTFALRDERLKIFSIKKSGIAAARNIGLQHARGEFIGFIDSDDWVEPTMFETMFKKATNSDSEIVMCGINTYDHKNRIFIPPTPYLALACIDKNLDDKVFNHKATGNQTFGISVTVWNKIYRTDFLKNNQIRFFEGLYFEDNSFFFETYLQAQRVTLTREPLYNYRINRKSSMIGAADKRYFDILHTTKVIESILRKTNNLEYLNDFQNRRIARILACFKKVRPKYKNEFLDLIKADFRNYSELEKQKLKPDYLEIYKNLMRSKNPLEYYAYENFYSKRKKLNKSIKKIKKQLRFFLTHIKKNLKAVLKKTIRLLKHFMLFKN